MANETAARRAPVLFGLALVASACGGAQADEGQSGQRVMISERLIACDTLLTELRHLDYNLAPESEMVALMEASDANTDRCAELWMERADTPGQRAIARHQARQLPFQALLVESALSARFDNKSRYCEILDDTFALLFESIAEIEESLHSGRLSEGEQTNVSELLEFDLEAVEVLVVHRDENCDE